MVFLFYLFLASLPFGTRILIYQFTTGFHEYEAVFLYASDVFLILFLAAFSFHSHVLKNMRMTWQSGFLAAFLVFSLFSIFFAVSNGLAVYNFARLLLLVAAALAVGKLLREKILKLKIIFAVIAGSAVFQSLIALAQFLKQSGLGLRILGESVLRSAAHPSLEATEGIAKIVVEGGEILRAYGTFPHPNVLAAFLLLGLFALYYFWLKRPSIIVSMGIFLTTLGLVFAFSRTAWLIAIVVSLFIIIYSLFHSQYRRQAIFLSVILFSIFYFLFSFFKPYILPRAKVSAGEPAVVQRLAYNELALELIKTRPLGAGIGNQVLYSVKSGLYQKFGMTEVWQWQPVHNIYLLVAAETGILGAAAFLLFIMFSISNFQNWKLSLENSIPKIMLAALLIFGMADHFLWTLQSGRLMLWLMIGIIIGVLSARSSTDRTHPSEG